MKKKLFCKIIFLLLFFVTNEKIYAQTNYKGLVVLIDFSDMPANFTTAQVNNIVNGVGYTEPTVTSSLRDYWYTQSRGKVVVTHDVVGYYRAPQTAAWYNTQTFQEFIELAKQALNWIIATNPGYDWNSLSLASGDMNRNGTEEGTFLSINFITTAWIPGTGGTHWLTGWTAPNGVSTQQITGSTFKAPWDTNVNLFWLTHEQGHLIWGWPDTYDNFAASHGTGIYSLMSGNQGTGDIEPVGAPFLASEKWVNIVDITTQSIVLTQDGNTVARFRNPSDPLEYFVIEARMRSTIGNAAFPVQRGLMIWHVDDNVTTSNIYPQMTPSQHYRVSVEQADGLFQLEGNINPGNAGDIYLPGKTFSDQSTPNAKWWDGSNSTLSINNIQLLSNNKISFNASSQFCSVGNSNNQNINVCHNNKTICINKNAVAAHLAHGDNLGPCTGSAVNRQDPTFEEYTKPGFNVYPNPNTGNFIATLNLPEGEMKEAIIQVINIAGQVVKKIKLDQQPDLTISLKESGIYLIRVITKNQVHEKKVTVIH